MKTVIMAGGKGTRIASVAQDIPKPMLPVAGKPVLEREIECLCDQGYTDIIITVSHLGSVIMDYFGNGEKFGVNIRYFNETVPLGNAGALFQMKDELTEDFLLINADAIFDIDVNRFLDFHKKHGGFVSLFTHPNDHPYDSGLIVTDEQGRVEKWLTKEEPHEGWYKNRVNAGIHIISPHILETQVSPGKIDLDRQLLKPLAGTGKMFAYDSPEYVKDMGTPERFAQVSEDFALGVVEAKNLSHRQKAIFLDRDGTLNKYVGFLRDINELELLDGVTDAVKEINASGYLAVVVTNQPVIARGEVTVPELNGIHNKLETLLGNEGAYIDGLYYCPHHPDKGFEGEIPELKFECSCRKPKPGMLIKASEDLNIDLMASWMIGDGKNDVEAGRNAGCRTIYIGTDGSVESDFRADTLKDAVRIILDN